MPFPANELPYLDRYNHSITSDQDTRYNCIAWAAGDQEKWWWPDEDGYWPDRAPREATLEAFLAAFQALGYSPCPDGDLELGFSKIAIYGLTSRGVVTPTHVARQLTDGRWTSKLGPLEDIAHKHPENVNGPAYGRVCAFLKRQTRKSTAHQSSSR